MAHVTKRGSQYRARYRADDGREISRSFAKKADAERWLTEQQHTVNTGSWVNPSEGRRTFGEVARAWQARQVHRPTTQEQVESTMKNHILPTFENRPIAEIRASDIQSWVKGRSEVLEASTVETAYRHLASIFRSAVEDRVIGSSPCNGRVKLPKITPVLIVPLGVDEVLRLDDAMPDRYRALVLFAAGSGVRQGEAFGVTLDRVDFLRRQVRIDRQMVLAGSGSPVFGPPKTDASFRTIPLADTTLEVLARHLEQFPANRDGLVFTAPDGGPIRRNRFGEVWRRARTKAKVSEDCTFHDLRHFYASLLIRHGESVKVVQRRLGHASASETLDTYSHLWPDSDDRTRDAISEVLQKSCGQYAASNA